MQTVKSEGHGTAPRNIVAIRNDADRSFPAFKESMTKEMAACGICMEFVQAAPGQTSVNAPWAQAFLQFRPRGREQTTVTQYGTVPDDYVSMYRYELLLTDMAEKQVVWKGQGGRHPTVAAPRSPEDVGQHRNGLEPVGHGITGKAGGGLPKDHQPNGGATSHATGDFSSRQRHDNCIFSVDWS
jgi:hypothetical protein